MSIRTSTSQDQGRTARTGARRRAGATLPRREAPGPEAAPPDAPASHPRPAAKDLAEERRLRESGGPQDRQLYACACGFTWRGAVSASAACPHCGATQAW